MSDQPATLSDEEAAFQAAWLGSLWPRYRPLFEGGAGKRPFEWRAALYPLWLGIPGLYWPLAVVVAVVAAGSAAVAVQSDMADPAVIAVLVAGLLALWPLVGGWAMIAAPTDGPGFLLPVGMIVISVALGMLAPRWIVAEGRRRWQRHASRVAAGETPPPPKAVTAFSPLRLVILLLVIAVPVWLLLFPQHHHDEEMYSIAAMKSDLRNLVTAEEAYFADHVTYTTALDTHLFRPSRLVTVTVTAADSNGYSAVATHAETVKTCGIFVGTGTPPYEGANEGEPRCAPAAAAPR